MTNQKPSPSSDIWHRIISHLNTRTGYIIYLTYRTVLSVQYPILQDCDEVYNYYEPLHSMLYDDVGLQTWEYSDKYRLRTYAFLYPVYVCAWLFRCISSSSSRNKIYVFYAIRGILAIGSGTVEYYLSTCIARSTWLPTILQPYTATADNKNNATNSTWQVQLLYLLYSSTVPGMYHASTALLPSTFVLHAYTACLALFVRYGGTIESLQFIVQIGTVATLCFGWPFGAVLWVPYGILYLYVSYHHQQQHSKWYHMVQVLYRVFLQFIVIQCLVTYIDYVYYGTFTVPNYAILRYNAMSGNDVLYGTEPLSYYMKNVILNLHGVALLAFGMVLFTLVTTMVSGVSRCTTTASSNQLLSPNSCMMVTIVPMILWCCILFPRAHKEERFLYPMYSTVCYLAAVFQTLLLRHFPQLHLPYLNGTKFSSSSVAIVLSGTLVALSMSRMIALFVYYQHAPFAVYTHLYSQLQRNHHHTQYENVEGNAVQVCVGTEWHRYPSSFFLPNTTTITATDHNNSSISSYTKDVRLSFLRTGDDTGYGQLPQYVTSSPLSSGVTEFHDDNRDDVARYTCIQSCSYLIAVLPLSYDEGNGGVSLLGYRSEEWEVVYTIPFLEQRGTTNTRVGEDDSKIQALLRYVSGIWYIPYASSEYVIPYMSRYAILQRR